MEVIVDRQDQAKLSRKLSQLQDELSMTGLQRVLERNVYEAMKDRIEDRFENEGDSTVGKWAFLKPATLKFRAWEAQVYALPIADDHPINFRRGRLRKFVTTSKKLQKLGTAAELVMPGDFPSREMEDKFRRAQQGKTRGGGKKNARVTTPRPVLAIGVAEQQLAEFEVQNWIDRMLSRL